MASPAASAQVLDIAALPSSADWGYRGGRNDLKAFCRSIFRQPASRFLRNEAGQLVVFRHADLRALSIRPELGCPPPAHLLGRRGDATLEDATPWVFANQLFFSNEPIHAPLRKIMLDHFGPKPTLGFQSLAADVADGLVASLEDGAEIDVLTALTAPMMTQFWGRLIGLDPSAIEALTEAMHGMAPLNFEARTSEQLQDLDIVFQSYRLIMEAGALEALFRGDNVIVDSLANALSKLNIEDDPTMAGIVPANVGAFLAGNLFDGLHTAALGAANALHAVLNSPQARVQVTAAPEKLAGVIAEALRLEPAILSLNRWALEDVLYEGMVIPKGTTLQMLWAAGGLDPSAFPDPERFDSERPLQGVTTFGSGTRICPGRFSASMLIRTLVQALDRQGVLLDLLEPAGAWYDGTIVGQLKSMPARVRRGPER